jgi:hypothetical protein
MKDFALYLLNTVICHVEFYTKGKYKNKKPFFFHFTLHSFFCHLLAYPPLPKAILIYHLQVASFTAHVRTIERMRSCQQGSYSQTQPLSWPKGHCSSMLAKKLAPKHCPALPK